MALGGLALAGALGVALLLTREEAPPPEPMRAPAPADAPRPAPRMEPAPAAPPVPAERPDPEAERRAAIRARLEASIGEHLPELKLSSDELDAATDALLRLRAARLELAALPRTPENAERRRELRAALGQAAIDFEYVVELDPAEFTEKVEEEDE